MEGKGSWGSVGVLLDSLCLYIQEHGFVADTGRKRLQCGDFCWLGTEQLWLAWTNRAILLWAANQLCVLGLALLWISVQTSQTLLSWSLELPVPRGPSVTLLQQQSTALKTLL